MALNQRTETTSTPAAALARRPPTPRRLQKRKLTLTQAADQWERARREIDRQKPLLEEAAAVLTAHFERTGRRSYKDRIVLTVGSRLVLEQTKVREFLGERLPEFQKRIQTKSLSLLK